MFDRWHGWMHHVFDEVPGEEKVFEYLATHTKSNNPYNTHVGLARPVDQLQQDQSQYR